MGILPPPKYCQAATKKLTFSTTSVLLLLNVPLSLSRGTVFRRPKNPRRGYRPKIAGILFVCNEPEGKYYTVPRRSTGASRLGEKWEYCRLLPVLVGAQIQRNCSARAALIWQWPNVSRLSSGVITSYTSFKRVSLGHGVP